MQQSMSKTTERDTGFEPATSSLGISSYAHISAKTSAFLYAYNDRLTQGSATKHWQVVQRMVQGQSLGGAKKTPVKQAIRLSALQKIAVAQSVV